MAFSFLFRSELASCLVHIHSLNTYVEGDELYVEHWAGADQALPPSAWLPPVVEEIDKY